MDEDVKVVTEGELRLLRPDVRASAEVVRALLHDDFREFGASGTVWDRESIVQATGADATAGTAVDDLRPARLGPDAILLTYSARRTHRASLRTSVWVRTGDGWRMLHHQGTRLPTEDTS